MKPIDQIKLFLITPPLIGHPDSFYIKVEEALSNGIRAIQFRNKFLSKRDAFRISIKLRDICSQYDALFIINDEIDLVLASDADGIHIGQEDFPLEWTRKILGSDKIIGVSTHQLSQALEAEKGGADYIGIGSLFSTSSKEKTMEVGLDVLKKIAQTVSIPIFGIGGISLSNISSVFRNGATGVAVISAVWNFDLIGDAVRKLNEEVNKVVPIH